MPEYEPYVRRFIERFAHGICADVGAGVGYHTLHMARQPRVKCVHAFEPIPVNYAKIYALKHSKIIVHPFALGELEGELEMVAPSLTRGEFAWINAMKPFRACPFLERARVKLRVPMKRLDNVLEHVDFIKIDVEGMEFQVIKGAGRAIERAYIVVELHLWGEYNQRQLIEYLARTHKLTSPWREGYALQHLYFQPKKH